VVARRARLTDTAMTTVSRNEVIAVAGRATATDTDRVGLPLGYPPDASGAPDHRRTARTRDWPPGQTIGCVRRKLIAAGAAFSS
jgi:hypothetical protein